MEPAQQMKETVDLRFYAAVLWRRKWIVLVPAVLAALTSVIVTLPSIMKPVYQSSSTLMIEFPQPLSKGLASLVDNPSVEEQLNRLQSQIQSNEFLTRMIVSTGLREDPAAQEWARKNARRYPDLSFNDLVDLKLIEYLRGVVRTSGNTRKGVQGSGNIIQVSVADYYPARARRLVQNITSGIIEAGRGQQLREVQSTGNFSAMQLQEYEGKLKDAERRLEEFRREQVNRRAMPTEVGPENLARAQDLRNQASADLRRQEQEMGDAGQSLRGSGVEPSRLDRFLAARGVAALLEQARGYERDYVRQSLSTGQSGQATAILLAREQDAMAAALRDTLQKREEVPPAALESALAYLRALAATELARTRLNTISGELTEYTHRLTSVPQADMELQRLEQEVANYRDLRNTFVTQLTSSQVTEAYGSSQIGEKISILEPAQHPLKPIRPKRNMIILLSVMAGLAVGMVGAFVLEHHDQTFRDVPDTERHLGVRVIGTIPNLENLARVGSSRRLERPLRAAAVERAMREFLNDSPGYQEFRKLSLGLLRLQEGGPKSIMVTSARRGEGKTTCAACLALALAKELPQSRVVLVDLDVRKSSLTAFFGVNGDSAQGAVFLQQRKWEGEPLRELILPNLRLLPIELNVLSEDEQVTAANVQWLMTRLKGKADRIIIDSPPNLPVPDPLVVGPEVEAVLVVVRAGVTPRETVRRGVDLQRQFGDNVVGVVMNNQGEALPYYYSPSHYGYGYSRRG